MVLAAVRFQLTLLFSDLANSTSLGRTLEPEHLAELIEKIRAIWELAASKRGGLIVRTQGDGALIVFGFPQPREDDGKRAVEAAFDIHQSVAQIVFEHLPLAHRLLQMHSGIHAGMVLLSPGDIERGKFDLTGDVANTTAHLSNLASSGQIIASLDALGPHANFFELGADPREPSQTHSLKDVRVILGRGKANSRFDAAALRGLTPLIGREALVSDIHQFLQSTKQLDDLRHRCLVLVGPGGIGKTRLIEEVVRSHTSETSVFMFGGCEQYLEAEVLQPFAQMLRTFFGIARDGYETIEGSNKSKKYQSLMERLGEGGEFLTRMITSANPAASPRTTASGIVGDFLAFFRLLVLHSPVVLVVDDWQWADDASRQLLGGLLEIPNGPIVVLACRPHDDGDDWIKGALQLRLDPLEESETRTVVRRWIPNADPFLCARIHAYSGGIPLFVEELCHSNFVDGLREVSTGQGVAQPWLVGLVTSRLARLPPHLVDIVRVCAVIGNTAPLWLLHMALGYAPLDEDLNTLVIADFVFPDAATAALRFKHGITRDAVYNGIGLQARTQLHEKVLHALSDRPGTAQIANDVEALCQHSRGAGHWAETADFAERSGDKASAAFALDRARTYYLLALEAMDRMPQPTRMQSLQWCTVVNKLGMTCIFDPLALGKDMAVFEQAVEKARSLGDAAALARSMYWLGYMYYGFGRFRESLARTREALALARLTEDKRLVAQVEATLGQVLVAANYYDEAVALIDIAVDAKRLRSRPKGGLAIGSAYALACKASVLADRGSFADAHACFDEAIELLDGSTHPVANSVRNWICVAYNWQGTWHAAQRVASESMRIAENTRALLLLAVSRSAAGYADWAAGNSAAGLNQMKEAMQWMEARHGRFYTSLHYGWIVEACAEEGKLAEVRHFAGRVFQRARQGERLGEAVACRGLAWAATLTDDQAAAVRWMRRAEAAALRRQSPREAALNLLMQGKIQHRLGLADGAMRTCEMAARGFDRLGMAWHAGAAERVHVLAQTK